MPPRYHLSSLPRFRQAKRHRGCDAGGLRPKAPEARRAPRASRRSRTDKGAPVSRPVTMHGALTRALHGPYARTNSPILIQKSSALMMWRPSGSFLSLQHVR
jgi:hypothetical protein